jgi:hypothetical protein
VKGVVVILLNNMSDKKIRLNSETSQNSVNEDSFVKINLENKTNLLPIESINNIVNLGDRFNKERQEATQYRLTGQFNTLFTNVLFNTSGPNSWKSLNQPKFRDETFPPDADSINDLDEGEDISYSESIDKYLIEDNGWFGYQDPNPNISESLCKFIEMEPNRNKYSMIPNNNVKNWEITITYPVQVGRQPGEFNDKLVNGGLLIVSSEQVVVNERNMVMFATPVKHGLVDGDNVELKGLSSYNGLYTVVRVGKSNGDDKEYYFTVDINGPITINENNVSSRMVRVVGGRNSVYYIRKFRKIKVKGNSTIENDDYEIFPLAFSQNIYEDVIPKYVFNEEIDISGLKDNLNRPLSELYLTVIKTDSENTFTPIKSGIKMGFIDEVSNINDIPDINRITNDTLSHEPLNDDVTINDNEFYGDVVEYNVLELNEKVLGDVYHRFNSINRENETQVSNVDFNGNNINLGLRYEGYMYKAHHKIKIKNFSNYIEQGSASTLNKPDYAFPLGDGRFVWRDLLDIGADDGQENFLDYPFLNGAHYIDTPINLALERQDPFNLYGLQYTNFPSDRGGKMLEDDILIKRSDNVC